MIRFELNDFGFALTNDQWATITGIIAQEWSRDYDIVEGDQGRGMVWLWVHYGPPEDRLIPDRHWIEADGTVSLVEAADWDWQGEDDDGPATDADLIGPLFGLDEEGVGAPTPPKTDKE